jgi:DNA-binding transcriptional MerR regulator
MMDDKQTTYYIGDISKTLGLSQRAIRYYEELGFIRPRRTEGGFRIYSDRDVDILRMVIRFKDLGMSLDEIRDLVSLGHEEGHAEALPRLRKALSTRQREFEEKIKRYQDGIDQINRVLRILSACATCGQPSDRRICEECLKKHGEKPSPFMESFLPYGKDENS